MPKETSKKLLWIVLSVSFTLLVLVIVVGWMVLRLDDVGTIATVIASPIALVTSCYSLKARSENLLKIRKSMIDANEQLKGHISDTNSEFIKAVDEQLEEIANESLDANILED